MTVAQNREREHSSKNDAVNSPETASLSGDREDVQSGDILPDVNPNATALGPNGKLLPPSMWGRAEPSEAVRSLPVSGQPEKPSPKGSHLEPTRNNSPERSKQICEGEYEQCPNPVVVERTDKETGEVENVEIDCDRKWCPYCGPKLKRRYVAHFTEEFLSLPSLKFVTLTLDPKAFREGVDIDPMDFSESRKYLLHIWERRFVKRVKRRSDGEVTYVASVERHESGQAHLHVVMSCTLTEDQLREQWFQSGGGVVMEATDLRADCQLGRKVGYVMKYCFQDSMGQSDGRNSVFCSEGIGYHSKEAKQKRRGYMEEETDGDPMEDWDPDRYEFDAPPGAGHADNGDRVTEEEKMRFDRIADEARSTKYIDWEEENAPRDGTRIRYERETGETTREPVRQVVTDSGELRIVDRA